MTAKPSAEIKTPLACLNSFADTSQVKSSILLAERWNISSADISLAVVPAREEAGGRETGGLWLSAARAGNSSATDRVAVPIKVKLVAVRFIVFSSWYG